jgi:hypothetical protein
LKVLEDTWMEIRRHPEIPAVVIIIASGTDGDLQFWAVSAGHAATSGAGGL